MVFSHDAAGPGEGVARREGAIPSVGLPNRHCFDFYVSSWESTMTQGRAGYPGGQVTLRHQRFCAFKTAATFQWWRRPAPSGWE